MTGLDQVTQPSQGWNARLCQALCHVQGDADCIAVWLFKMMVLKSKQTVHTSAFTPVIQLLHIK